MSHRIDPYEFDETTKATVKGWDGLALVEAAFEASDGWAFDVFGAGFEDERAVELNEQQHQAAVRVVTEPENADCERGGACVVQRPTLIVGGDVRRHGADFIGFHLVEDPGTGYERMRFKRFYVTTDGTAICEACAADVEHGVSQ